MRVPKYLSHSSVNLFRSSPTEYYRRYCSECPPDREPQTQAMSIGSAFDAWVKSALTEDLQTKVRFDRRSMFEEQVEEHNRDWAWINGERVFSKYKEVGAYADLLALLQTSIIEPRFEFEIISDVQGVPIKGYPDLYMMTKDDCPLVIDFKVNGYCSANGLPLKGSFVKSYPWKFRRKEPMILNYKGVLINNSDYFESVDRSWAQQNVMYSWLLGCPVGSEFLIGIEQLAFTEGGGNGFVVGSNRGKPSVAFQNILIAELKSIWQSVNSGVVCEGQDRLAAETQRDRDIMRLMRQ